MRLDRAWIAAHIPHAGGMCLLDEVVEWGEAGIRCRSGSHRAPDNPLRAHGRLGAVCGIEYAAQAMAVDGAVRATLAPGAGVSRAGMLASVRGVTMSVTRLDDISGDLYASASRIHGDGSMILYDFAVADASRVLLSGRAAIAFGPTSRTPAGERAQP